MLRTLAALISLTATPSFAQDCGPTEEMVYRLLVEFGERPVFSGRTFDGKSSAIMSNPETGSWSLIITDGDISCLGQVGDKANTYSATGERL